MGSHTEDAFESAIELELIGQSGWASLPPTSYDSTHALIPEDLFGFLAETQPTAWSKLVGIHGGDPAVAKERILRRVGAQIDQHGTIHCLRHGIDDNGVTLRLAYFRPASGLSPDAMERYEKNRLSVVRQVHYDGGANSIDLLLSVNGLPVATAELKNPLTHQDVDDAKRQYREDRDPAALLFARRAVVHFAVDPDLVFMTTRLAGEDTRFLPFNQGSELDGSGGPGNPPSVDGSHRTAYLWRDVWQRDAFLELIRRYLHTVDDAAGSAVIFPRYHQWDVVRKALAHAREHGPGHNYLIQHSAGSGKSMEISWLAHGLSALFSSDDEPVFDKVIVVTDRVVLDRQLQAQVQQFEQTRGVVQRIDKDSTQLAAALASVEARIIVTTLQKFPVVLERLEDSDDAAPSGRFAIIVDEAHSSQTGESAHALKEVLGDEVDDPEDPDSVADALAQRLAKNAASRGQRPNLSFFAFTATPKAKTLELFGTLGPDGNYHPFHLYSMRQAIGEGFILDVLRAYTTYDAFYRLATKAGAEEKEFEKGKLAAAIARHVRLHPWAIAQKVEIIVEHHRAKVSGHLQGRAKSMVVTASRLDAVRYKQAIDKYLGDHGYDDLKALVAFSGTVSDPDTGGEHTEAGMNPPGKEVSARFQEPEYGILIVAEKFQTGFDQPLLTAMYVDKSLKGVSAVQTLSRLNRTYPGKPLPFVLDFVNEAEDIRTAFSQFYEEASALPTDPNLLYDTLTTLRQNFPVLVDDEVRAFARAFLAPELESTRRATREKAHAALYALSDMAVERFCELGEDEQEEFRGTLDRYVRMYAFLSQVIPHVSADAERYYLFGRVLVRRLPSSASGAIDVGSDITLTHFRLEQDRSTVGELVAADDPQVAFPTDGGTPQGPVPLALLIEIIEAFNDRFGAQLAEEDALPFEHIKAKALADASLATIAHANSLDQFELIYEQRFMDHVLDADLVQNQIFRKLLDDDVFRADVCRRMAAAVYAQLRDEGTPA